MGSQRIAVYRLFCPDGKLVYIGRSLYPEDRIRLHRRCTHGWQSELGEATIEWFPNATAARRAAVSATLHERPENVDPTLDLRPETVVPVFLYRLYSQDDELLYIGVTKDLKSRLESHRFAVPWERYTWEEFPSRALATAAEGEAILAENPTLNVTRGKNGPGSEWRSTTKSVYETKEQLRARMSAGEISAREALEALSEFPRVSVWRAAGLLGLENGGYSKARTLRTVDQVLELNGLHA